MGLSTDAGVGMVSAPDHCRRQHRIRFALFIKVLLKLIDDKWIREQAKCIIHAYVKKNKGTRHSSASHLEEEMELPLRGLVGDSVWWCASHYTRLYFQQKEQHPNWKPPRLRGIPRSISFASSTSTTTSGESSSSSTDSLTTTSMTEAVYPPVTESRLASEEGDMIFKKGSDSCDYDLLPEPLVSLLAPPPLRLVPSVSSVMADARDEEHVSLPEFQPLPAVESSSACLSLSSSASSLQLLLAEEDALVTAV